MTSHEDSLFSLKWKYKKNEHVLENEEQVQLISDNCNNPTLNSLTDNVLYYIAGYVIKKISPTLTCETCFKSITDDSYVQDHTHYTIENESFKTLTRMKNRRGLELASESVFKVIKTTETYFKSVVSDKQQLCSE